MWRELSIDREAWQAAEPFPHLVVEDFATDVSALLEILAEEPIERRRGEHYDFEASDPEPRTDAMKELRASFTKAFAPAFSALSGRRLERADMRVYAYREGSYLLPHSDHRADVGRVIAYAHYLPSPEPPVGGELDLYRVRSEDGAIVETTLARTIACVANRIVFFDVSDVSLHRVREVMSGARLSVSGWFYP